MNPRRVDAKCNAKHLQRPREGLWRLVVLAKKAEAARRGAELTKHPEETVALEFCHGDCVLREFLAAVQAVSVHGSPGVDCFGLCKSAGPRRQEGFAVAEHRGRVHDLDAPVRRHARRRLEPLDGVINKGAGSILERFRAAHTRIRQTLHGERIW